MDFLSKSLSGLMFVFFTSTAFAATDCISKQDMAEIAAKYSQFKNVAGAEYCNDGSETWNLVNSLMFMRRDIFAKNMPASSDELFSGTFASSWWKYFIGRIDSINVQKNCPKGVGAYVMPLFGKTMYVCPMMLTSSFSALDLASVFMHEARHIDGYPHMTCTKGPRKGIQGACDTDISDKGSYAVTVETYAQIGQYAVDLHPALKAYSRASAIIYADEAFENPVTINRQHQFMVMTKNQQFHNVDVGAAVKVQALGNAPALGQIFMRANHMVLFPDDKNLGAEYVFANDEGKIVQSPGADAVEYNSQTPAQKAQLVSIYYGAQWGAKVYVDKMRFSCDPSAATTKEVALTGKPLSIIYPNGYARDTKINYLVMENGSIMEFGCKDKNNGFVQASSLKFDRLFKREYKSGAKVLGLTPDGNLFSIANGVSTPVQTAVNGQIHELVPSQDYAFFN